MYSNIVDVWLVVLTKMRTRARMVRINGIIGFGFFDIIFFFSRIFR